MSAQRMAVILSLFFYALLTQLVPAESRFATVETEKVPINRLLKNLEAKEKRASTDESKALLQFQIGRLNSMAYALKTEVANVRKDEAKSSPDKPFYGYHCTDYTQFDITERDAKSKGSSTPAQLRLQQAIAHLRKATLLDPSLLQARLGLAWCLEQSGAKREALPLYRAVWKEAWQKEKSVERGMRGFSIAAETAQYLIPLLDKSKDAAEIADIADKTAHLDKIYRMITPLIVPLVPDLAVERLLDSHLVTFDLDGTGKRNFLQWTSENAGWLVYDADGSRRVTSGLQLFGQRTFWIFWKDGYQALAALDDDQNGLLEGRELRCLAVWRDRNYNGVSDPGEVSDLSALGIQALSCLCERTPDGVLRSKQGVKFRSGKYADTYDLILKGSN